MKRLNIVVPYRAREAHLKAFVPHLRAYFSRDKVDRDIPYRVLVIEQENGLPFNRGAMKNIGFQLGRDESDYTCFHDIDYLPIWADYTWVDVPTPLVWHGAKLRHVAPGRSDRAITHTLEQFYGAAVLVPNALFERVNGYANIFWGWGFEDTDLHDRFVEAGIALGRRKGSFFPLDHDNEGYQLDGNPSLTALRNELLYKKRRQEKRLVHEDGLSSIAYEVLDRRVIPEGPEPERPASWEIVTVRLNMQPDQKYAAQSVTAARPV